MANPRADRPYLRREALQSLNFRVLRPNLPLEEQGYYIGFPCTRGHTIRDQTRHWCYHCVQSIQSNICGADFNYMDHQFRKRGHDFFIAVLDERGLLNGKEPVPNFHRQCWVRETPLGKGDRMDCPECASDAWHGPTRSRAPWPAVHSASSQPSCYTLS